MSCSMNNVRCKRPTPEEVNLRDMVLQNSTLYGACCYYCDNAKCSAYRDNYVYCPILAIEIHESKVCDVYEGMYKDRLR